jgi:hypothetical protein
VLVLVEVAAVEVEVAAVALSTATHHRGISTSIGLLIKTTIITEINEGLG